MNAAQRSIELSSAVPLVQVRALCKYFRGHGAWLPGRPTLLRAVDDVSLEICPGEVLGLVGESGCGKTTLGRCILRLVEPTSGQLLFAGQDLLALSGSALRRVRRQMQLVFQNPLSSLSPRLRILDVVGEPLRTHLSMGRAEREEWVVELLKSVGLDRQHLARYPHELSGGQCQRVAVARALALQPRFIVLDEPTSALDVSVQAQILNLLMELKERYNLTYLFISHDLRVVQYISERIAVMYLGQVVEVGPVDEVFHSPVHPYAQALLAAIPLPIPGLHRERFVLQGSVPSPANPPPGCRFHTRCPVALPACQEEMPQLRQVGLEHLVACHRAGRQD
jgi:oligopeptide/dipeptide ABC transporter ATP-binding protein